MHAVVSSLVRFLILLTRKIQGALFAMDRRLQSDFSAARHRSWVRRSARVHDMAGDADEKYFGRQYWSTIENHLDAMPCDKSGTYYDLGCGQGRLSLVLAGWCGDGGAVVGVDLSKIAIGQARDNAKLADQNNTSFEVSDIASFLDKIPDDSAAGVMITEVLYFTPDASEILASIRRVLKPGGILVASVRSQYFYALSLVKEGTFDAVPMLLSQRSGRLMGGDVWFNWSSAEEIRAQLTDDFGFEVIEVTGIGNCSGIAGDPHAAIARPSHLSEADQATLMELENSIGRAFPDGGRYILVVARNPL